MSSINLGSAAYAIGGIAGSTLGIAVGKTSDDPSSKIPLLATAGAAVGAAAVWATSKTPNIIKNIGAATISGVSKTDRLGKFSISLASKAAGYAGSFMYHVATSDSPYSPKSRWENVFKKFTSGLVKKAPAKEVFDDAGKLIKTTGGGLRLTKLGKFVAGAAFLSKAIHSVLDAEEESRMGYADNEIATPTPRLVSKSFVNNAGATGDLVFALYKNRQG